MTKTKTLDLYGTVEHRRDAVRTLEKINPQRVYCALVYSYDVGLDELHHDLDALGWDTTEARIELNSEPDYGDMRMWIEVRGPAGCAWCPTGKKGRAAEVAKRRAELERKEAKRAQRAKKSAR